MYLQRYIVIKRSVPYKLINNAWNSGTFGISTLKYIIIACFQNVTLCVRRAKIQLQSVLHVQQARLQTETLVNVSSCRLKPLEMVEILININVVYANSYECSISSKFPGIKVSPLLRVVCYYLVRGSRTNDYI